MLRKSLYPYFITILALVLAGILHILSVLLGHEAVPYHGVKIESETTNATSASFDSALKEIANHQQRQRISLVGYVYTSDGEERTFLTRSRGYRRFFIDNVPVVAEGNAPVPLRPYTFRDGWHRLELQFKHPDSTPLQFFWTRSAIETEPIPAYRTYVKPVALEILTRERFAGISEFAARIVLSAGILVTLLWLGIRIFRAFLNSIKLPKSPGTLAALAVCLILMAWIRASGIPYELREGLHPDERVAQGAVRMIRQEGLRPKQLFYSYGYYYISAAVESILAWISPQAPAPHLALRSVSFATSIGSCVLVYFIAAGLLGVSGGIAAALLFGFSFVAIQVSHFGIIEPTMVFFFLLGFWMIGRLSRDSTIGSYLFAGLCSGLAVGIKQTALLIGVVFIAQHLWNFRKLAFSPPAIRRFAAWFLAAAAGYFVLSPYTLIELTDFLRFQFWQLRSLQGEAQTAMFFQSRSKLDLVLNDIRHTMGVPVVIAALAGAVVIWKRFSRAGILVVPFTAIYFLILAVTKTAVFHYYLLLAPFISILAASALILVQNGKKRIWIPALLALLLALPSHLQTARLMRIVHGTDTRRQAEIWAYRNIAPGSVIEYEFFGPRFTMPFFQTLRRPLFSESRIRNASGLTNYYFRDSLSSYLYLSLPPDDAMFQTQKALYDSLETNTTRIMTFSGLKLDTGDLYNPDIFVYFMADKNETQNPENLDSSESAEEPLN